MQIYENMLTNSSKTTSGEDNISLVSKGWPLSDLMKFYWRQTWDKIPNDFPKGPWCGDLDLYLHWIVSAKASAIRTLSGELFGSPEDSQGTPNKFFW